MLCLEDRSLRIATRLLPPPFGILLFILLLCIQLLFFFFFPPFTIATHLHYHNLILSQGCVGAAPPIVKAVPFNLRFLLSCIRRPLSSSVSCSFLWPCYLGHHSTSILKTLPSLVATLASHTSHHALVLDCVIVLTWPQPCIQNPNGGEIGASSALTAPPCLLKIVRYVFFQF